MLILIFDFDYLIRSELSGDKMEELALSYLPSYDWSLAEQVVIFDDLWYL